MHIEHLISLVRSNNKDFLKDYYDQIKSGISDSNTKIWKYTSHCGIIIICYFLLSQNKIGSVKLSVISLSNPEIISLLTPPLFIICYLVLSLHSIRYNRLTKEYKLLTLYFSEDKDIKQHDHFYTMPIHFFEIIFDILFSPKSSNIIIFNLILSLPFYTIHLLAISFVCYSLYNIWPMVPEVSYTISFCISIWLSIVTLLITSMQSCNNFIDNKKLKQYYNSIQK